MKKAVILAAGEGQRLRPFTVNKPKAMLQLADKPLLEYVIDSMVECGIRDIVIVAGYHQETIMDYFGTGSDRGISLTYVVQDKQLGTAHALKQAEETVNGEFIVLPGDNLINRHTLSSILDAPAPAVLGKPVSEPSRYGVLVAEDGIVRAIEEKPEIAFGQIVSTGIYKFNSDIFKYINNYLDIPDVINAMIDSDIPLHMVTTDEAWLDIVHPRDILDLNEYVLRQLPPSTCGTIHKSVTLKGNVSIGDGTVIHPNSYIEGPVIIGRNCEIGPGVFISGASSISDNVVLKPFSEISNSVIGADSLIDTGAIIRDSVIDSGCTIGTRFTALSGQINARFNDSNRFASAGIMMGAGCEIGSSVVALPGTIMGNNCRIKPLKVISDRLPDESQVF